MSYNYVFLSLIYRLRWYKSEMLHKLIRYKHGLLILLAMFVPDFHAVSSVVLSPIRTVLVCNTSLQVCFVSLVGLQVLFISWAAIQKPAIMGIPFRSYFYTLPVAFFRFIKIDLILLFVANLILWIPFIYVFFEINTAIEFVRFSIVISGIILSQMLFLYGYYAKFSGIFISDLLFVLSAAAPKAWLSFLLTAISCGILVVCVFPGNYFKFASVNIFENRFIKNISLRMNLPLEAAILIRSYTFPFSVRFFVMLIIATVGCILLKYSALRFYYWVSIHYFMTLITFVGSGLYTLLHEASHFFRTYLKTLPRSTFYWNARECLIGSAPCFVVSVLFLSAQKMLDGLSIFQFLMAIIAQVPLLLLLYFVRTQFTKQATFFSFLISAAWSSFLIMCVHKGYL